LSQIFPKWTNSLPLIILVVAGMALLGGVGFFWYYGSPWFINVGYRPAQPVPYSHKLHAGDLGVDCRYCHIGAEKGKYATVPPVQTCMNCHTMVKPESEKLALIRASWTTGQPLEWVRIHKLPEYAYFNHSIHIAAGVGCASCHGRVDRMEKVTQEKPLSMGWCLDCHRNPEQHLRPLDKVTDMNWEPGENQAEFAAEQIRKLNLAPPENCSACHR